MAYGIGGGGIVGLAPEATPNTYVAPTKFFPITSESLNYTEAHYLRRSIRQNVDVYGVIQGPVNTAGDMEFEATEDVIPYFLNASRLTVVKTGTTNFTYTCTPNANATASKTLSLTIVRNSAVFAFTGCTVGSWSLSTNDGILMMRVSIVGSDESTQTAPTPTFAQIAPFATGQYTFSIPQGTPITDVDAFEFTAEDNAEPQFRLKSTGRGAQYIKFGERNARLSFDRDFPDKTEFADFKATTATTVRILASKGANNSVQIDLPQAVRDVYNVQLGAQGDLIRAHEEMQAVFDNTAGYPFLVTVKNQENFTP